MHILTHEHTSQRTRYCDNPECDTPIISPGQKYTRVFCAEQKVSLTLCGGCGSWEVVAVEKHGRTYFEIQPREVNE